jgi:hypothetical protein
MQPGNAFSGYQKETNEMVSVSSTQLMSQPWPDRLMVFMESLIPLPTWRERTYARRTSRELLELYHRLATAAPDLTGRSLYERVVAERTGLDSKGVRVIVQRAEESFADWPVERPLMFRDIVLYLILEKRGSSAIDIAGARGALGGAVAEIVPPDL